MGFPRPSWLQQKLLCSGGRSQGATKALREQKGICLIMVPEGVEVLSSPRTQTAASQIEAIAAVHRLNATRLGDEGYNPGLAEAERNSRRMLMTEKHLIP